MCSDIVIKAQNLSKCFPVFEHPKDRLKQMVVPKIQKGIGLAPSKYFQEFWALNDVSLEIARGETVGIIGQNGSGKSTLLQLISGTMTPTSGVVQTNGRVAALLELGTGFNPEFTGKENVYLNAALHGLSRQETTNKFEEIKNFADIGDFIDQPVKTYSSGMIVRLAFAVIAHVDADVLIVDEALSVGDAIFTQKCMRFIRSFQKKGTLLFVSHDMSTVQNLCESAIWLAEGKVELRGTAKEVSEAYLKYSLQQVYGNSTKLYDLESQHSIESRTNETKQHTELVKQPYHSQYHVVNNLSETNGWSTGQAKIVSVQLLNAHGSEVPIFEGGEIITIKVYVEVYSDFAQPIVGFVIKDRIGQDLFGENTLPFNTLHIQSVKKGQTLEGEFTFILPMLPDGQYSVMASFADGDLYNNVQHHWLHDAIIINVSSSKVRWGLVGVTFDKVMLKVLS